MVSFHLMVNGITSPYTLPVKWLHSQYLLSLEKVVSSFLAVQDEAPLLVPLLQPQDTELKEKNVVFKYNSANIFLEVVKFGQPFAQFISVTLSS